MFSFCIFWLQLSFVDEKNSHDTKREFATGSRGWASGRDAPGMIYRDAMLLENLELASRFYKFSFLLRLSFQHMGAQRFHWQRANPQDRPNKYIHIAKGALL